MTSSLTVFKAYATATGYTPWVTDGTSAGTVALSNVTLPPGVNYPDFTPLGNGQAILIGAGNQTLSIWRTDGTLAGTIALRPIPVASSNLSYNYQLLGLNNGRALYLISGFTTQGLASLELFATDGTVAGTNSLKVLGAGQSDYRLYGAGITSIGNGRAVFQTRVAAGLQLWTTDGTAAGTIKLQDSTPYVSASNPGRAISDTSNFVSAGNGRTVFLESAGDGYSVWSTDGTVAGTVQIRDPSPYATGFMTALPNGKVIFQAAVQGSTTPTTWQTDGTRAGTFLVPAGTLDTSLAGVAITPIGNGLGVFIRLDATNGRELWVTDGTAASTHILKDIYAGNGDSYASDFRALGNGKLLFTARSVDAGFEPWITDGTTAGTMLLKDLVPGMGDSVASGYTLIGNRQAIFEASSTGRDGQVWVTDGTAAGTALVKTVYNGVGGAQAAPQNFVNLIQGAPVVPYFYSISAGAPKPDGLTGLTPFTFTMTRTGDLSQAATIAYTASAAGGDSVAYSLITNPTGTVTFAAGIALTSLTINLRGAQLDATQMFAVTLDGAPADASATTRAVGTVLSNAGIGTILTGTAGQTQFVDTPGTQLYIGANGETAVQFSEGLRGDVFLLLANGDISVTHGGQVDYLRGITELRFLDGRLVFDVNDAAAAVTRMYQAGLGRLPDQGGLNYWINGLQHGAALADIAAGFLNSAEFIGRFGTGLANGDFVTRIYQNVLNRAPDSGGLAFWSGTLNGNTYNRSQVLAGISDSTENKTATASLVASGIWDVSETATQVARLYDTALGRLPDAAGLSYWKTAIDSGSKSLADLAISFVTSPEFLASYGPLSNRDFVEKIYGNTLGRHSDQQGLDYWTAALDRGDSRSSIVTSFSESPEHQGRTNGNILNPDPANYGIKLAS